MSDDARPSKRPRASGPGRSKRMLRARPSSSSNNGLAHHEEFWFDDGNIVLVAGNTAFRVYRGLLSAHSTVFSDMFEASSPMDGETLEGCPVVRLSDSAQDLAHLLKILIPKDTMCVSKRSPSPSFDELFAVVRLAHKYGIVNVERQGLEAVQEIYGSDVSTCFDPSSSDDSRFVGYAIGAVNLARLTNTPSILPVAMLRCACLGGSVTDGWRRDDGSVEQLSLEDLKRVVNGREALARRGTFELLNLFSHIPARYCCVVDLCRETLSVIMGSLASQPCLGSANIFEVHRSTVDRLLKQSWCHDCAGFIRGYGLGRQKQMWDALPEMFDLKIRD